MITKLLHDARFLREKARADYLDTERDLFERLGTTAGRHLTDDDRRLLARLGGPSAGSGFGKVKVRTIRTWCRKLIDSLRSAAGGRTPITPEIQALVIKIAVEKDFCNDSWGRRRICGDLDKLGIDISSSSVRRILKRQGIPPAPQRGHGRDHDLTVVGDHAKTVAIDFAQKVILDGWKVRLMYILLAIHIPTREATVVGVTEYFDEAIMAQFARNLTMAVTGFLSRHGADTIILDRDSLYTQHFNDMIAAAGVKIKLIAPRAPWENGIIERFVQTLKHLVLRKVLCLSETDLWVVLDAAILHYKFERPHQSLWNRPITLVSVPPDVTKPINKIDHLGGAIHHYARAS